MSFKVNPAGVREFQSTIGALSDDASAAVKYVQQWTDVGYAERSDVSQRSVVR